MPPSVQLSLLGSVLASAIGALVMCLLVIRYGFTPAGDDEDGGARRQLATRLGHAAAAVCFAATAMFAVIALAQRPAPTPTVAADRMVRVEGMVDALRAEVDALAGVPADVARAIGMRADVVRVAEALRQTDARVTAAETSIKRLGDDVAQAVTSVHAAVARARQLERTVTAPPRKPAAAPVVAAPVPRPVVSEPAVETRPEPPRPPVERSTPEPRSTHPKDTERWVPTTSAPATAPVPVVSVPPAPPASRTAAGPPAEARAESAAAASVRATTPRPAPAAAPPLSDKVRQDWETVRRGLNAAGDEVKSVVRELGRRLRDLAD